MRFHFGVSMGPTELLVILLVLVIVIACGWLWVRDRMKAL